MTTLNANSPALHPRTAEVVQALQAAQQEMNDLLATIPASHRDAPAAEGAWSIAQVIEHLAMVEDGAGRLLGNFIKQVRDIPETEIDAIAPTIERFQVWDPSRGRVAPEFVSPKGQISFDEALTRQSTARARVIEALIAASGCALGTVNYPHPALGTLTGYQWALVTAQHQRRHLPQIAAVSSSLSS
ncbi:MAG TPA: DinB family protein [Gemmatimonas sp.]|uniref:DinB family protein n=1 Tax=Gemmatimonas sp. TaxID=1962908 RepID=UPI002EDA1E28